MTRTSKLLIAAAASMTVFGGTAFADDPAPDPTEASEAKPDPTQPAVEASGAFSATNWSMSFIDRPINLLMGMIRIDGALGILKVSFTAPPVPPATVGVTTTSTGIALNAGVGYGVSDKLEVGGGYGISLKEFSAKGPLSAYALFAVKNEAKLRVSVGGRATLNLASDNSFGIAAGLALQYHLGPKLFLYMPPSHLTMGLKPAFSLAINLPVGVGIQATPNVFASLETNLFDISLKPSGHAFIFADRTPLFASAYYSPSNTMDLGVSVGAIDVAHFADLFAIVLSVRLYMGKVPGAGHPMLTTTTTAPEPPAM